MTPSFNTKFLATWKEPGKVAIEAAWSARQSGGSLLDSLEQGLAAAENDTNLVAIGRGSLPNQDGVLELDAAIMEGKCLRSGAVCALKNHLPAISIARKVMEATKHMMLAGDAAARFAVAQGFEECDLATDFMREKHEQWKRNPREVEEEYIHSSEEESHSDTVTMLGLEPPAHVVAASSTSGLAWKLPGRVGDSPIVGAGIYADDEVGCAGATGEGEELWKAMASFHAVEAMRRGASPLEACHETVARMVRRRPESSLRPSVVLALGKDGRHGAATSKGVFDLWTCEDGVLSMETFRPL